MVNDVHDKVKAILAESRLGAILAFGADNVQYLADARLPFLCSYPDRPVAILWAKDEEPVAVCPENWETSIINLSRVKRTWGYTEKPGDLGNVPRAVAKLVDAFVQKGGAIGLDLGRIPVALHDELRRLLKDYELTPVDGGLRELRSVKTKEEAALLEEAAYRCDHAVFGVAHHVLVTSSRSEMSLGEELRVHAMERNLDVVGHHSVSQGTGGESTRKHWNTPPAYGIGWDRKLQPGEFVRMEIRYSIDGYWSDACRLLTMGQPSPEQRKAYASLVALREKAVAALKPGVKASAIYQAVKEEAERLGVELVDPAGVGHGVGVTAWEPPFLTAADDTEILSGMVLVVNPAIRGPDGELLWMNDTVHVTEAGSRVIGWYVDWRAPYEANYTL